MNALIFLPVLVKYEAFCIVERTDLLNEVQERPKKLGRWPSFECFQSYKWKFNLIYFFENLLWYVFIYLEAV
jgi:hypothetical protein